MQDRLTEVEIRVTHMEQALNELSDVLIRQQSLIDVLEGKLERLDQRFDAADSAPADASPASEKPPHY